MKRKKKTEPPPAIEIICALVDLFTCQSLSIKLRLCVEMYVYLCRLCYVHNSHTNMWNDECSSTIQRSHNKYSI